MSSKAPLVLVVTALACTRHPLIGVTARDAGSAKDLLVSIPEADGWVHPDADGTVDASGTSQTDGVEADGGMAGARADSAAGDGTFEAGARADSAAGDGTFEAGARADSAAEAGADTGTVVSMVALGHASSCALVNGGVRCWGWNGQGQLGNGTTTDSPVPTQVHGLGADATAIAMGLGHACAVVRGAALCWGANSEGELGNGTHTDSLVPVQVRGLSSGVTAIAAGSSQAASNNEHVCAVVNGGVWCWGDNTHGQLGNNTTVDSAVPVQAQGLASGATAVAVSDMNSCAIVNGGAFCWGLNGEWQIGEGTLTRSLTPIQVQGLTAGVTAISVGYGFACAG